MTSLDQVGSALTPDETVARRKGAWTDTSPHPWRRYLARALDTIIVGAASIIIARIGLALASPELSAELSALSSKPYGVLVDLVLIGVAAMPGLSLMIGLTGSSLGKWFFGVRVVKRNGRPIGVGRAFMRELRVWIFGLGLNLPLVSFITSLVCYGQLEDRRATSWDSAQHNVVLHRPRGVLQTLLSWTGFLIVLILTVGARILSMSAAANP